MKLESPPCEARLTGLGGGAGWPHLLAFGRRLCSRIFPSPLEPSHQFLHDSDVIWFGSLSLSSRTLLLSSLKLQYSPKLWKLLC